MKKIVECKNINYRYDQRKTDGITNINLTLHKAECVCLIGPSGSGKTTTAKLIAEFLHPQNGTIKFFNNLKTAYVQQNSILPEDKTVIDYLMGNLQEEIEEEKKENLIRTTLLLLNISNETHSSIHSLSGGQRQRVIMANALIKNPDLIILDEPFGHLDEKLRYELMSELFSLFKDQSIACLWVTHDTREALSYSDRIILLNYGVIQQDAAPFAIYHRPANLFTADFFGKNNSLIGKLVSVSDNELQVKVLNKEVVVPRPDHFLAKEQQDILLIIRPEYIQLTPMGEFTGKVVQVLFQGPFYSLEVRLPDGFHVWLYKSGLEKVKRNDKVQFTIDFSKVYCLDEV